MLDDILSAMGNHLADFLIGGRRSYKATEEELAAAAAKEKEDAEKELEFQEEKDYWNAWLEERGQSQR